MNMFWKMEQKKRNEKLSLYCLVGGVFDSLHCEARSTRGRLRFPTKEIITKITFIFYDSKICAPNKIQTEIQCLMN